MLTLPNRSVDFSDAIGGALLEEVYPVPATVQTHRACCLYLNEDRSTLPTNARLITLAGVLGWPDVPGLVLCGDALITGLLECGNDDNVPEDAVRAARRLGLLPAPAPPGPPTG